MALFAVGRSTLANYNSLVTKDENKMYIISDKQLLYIGSTKYTGTVEFVATLEGLTGVLNTIYVVNNGTGGIYAYNGTSFAAMTKPITSTISTEAVGDYIPTDKAVVDYVVSAITSGISLSMPIDDASTTATDKGWSAYKLNSELGNIQAALAAITGE